MNDHEQADQDAFVQNLLDYADAEAHRLGLTIGWEVLGIVTVAMALAVDLRAGDVAAGESNVITLAEAVGVQMREWTLEERTLHKEVVN